MSTDEHRDPVRFVELDASEWMSVLDFCEALKSAIGAPKGHGSSIDAFLDTMIYHDNINALKSPYTIRVINLASAPKEVMDYVKECAGAIEEAGMADRGTDLEIRFIIES